MKRLRQVRGTIVHHTAAPKDLPIQCIRSYHIDKRGFEDIGYHYVLLRVGACDSWCVVGGRSTEYQGEHCRGRNHDTIGIAVSGCYESYRGARADALTEVQMELLAELQANLVTQHDLPLSAVMMHCECRDTLCPGHGVRVRWPKIIAMTASILPWEGEA